MTISSLLRVHHLVGSAEIQAMLGLSRQRVDQLSHEPGFPKPVVVLDSGRVWRRSDIERWAKRTGYAVSDADG